MQTVLMALLLCTPLLSSAGNDDKPTSLSAARSEVEANLKTPEGKAFDRRLGDEFVKKHLEPFRQCKQTAGGDLTSFWILIRLGKDGSVREVLLYPATKLGTCAREPLLQEKFIQPPRPNYWVSVFMKLGK